MEIKGFITNLGKYDEGHLIGEWITFPIDGEELEAVCKRIGINEEYEEIFFTDWECEIDCGFGEYESIESVNEIAEDLERLDTYDIEKLEAIMEANGDSVAEAMRYMDDCVYYPGCTLEDVAYDLVNECCDLPEFALHYFDYEAFARDLEYDGYTETDNGVIYIC